MRVVSLSDHPAAMLRDAQQRRLAAERDAGLAYQDVLAEAKLAAGMEGNG
jgi:hypothetical protein